MEKIISDTKPGVVNLWHQFEILAQPYLKDLDPSLLQNIILGILAIFIPFAIVFLTDILSSEKERSEFKKMVLSEEVFGVKKIFWLSVIGIGSLSFFSGTTVSISRKIISIVITLIIVIIFGRFFKKTLRFSEGYRPEFEISFLKNLKLSKILFWRNKLKMERMVRAWNSFWSEKLNHNEKGYASIFISHIDTAIEMGEFELTIQLSKSYVNNIEKRDVFLIGYEILPKVFQWNELLWKKEQYFLTTYALEKKIHSVFSQRHFPTFRKWVLKILNRIYKKKDYFWNWSYFEQAFLPPIMKILLNDGHGLFEFFTVFKKHIDESEVKLNTITDKNNTERYWNYIVSVFSSFCQPFFENINDARYKFDIWGHYFPKEWKITSQNSSKRIPRIFLHEFEKWALARIFEKKESGFDDKLSEVVGGLFPSVHSDLFPAFLVLLYSSEVKYSIEKDSNIFFVNNMISWSGDKTDEEINEMRNGLDSSQKDETIRIIYLYFGHWSPLKLFRDDLTEQENSEWKEYTEEKQKQIIKRVKKNKLQKIANELRSEEIINICKDYKEKELRRVRFLELINLLIKGLENNP